MVNFGYLGVSSPLHDAASVRSILTGLAGDLHAAGGAPAESAHSDAPLAVVVLTGGTEPEILRAAAARPGWEPIMVVAHPWHNSLPAALEAVARLHQDGRPARIVSLDGGRLAVPTLAEAATDIHVVRQLHRLTIGLVGTPSDWLVASSPSAQAVLTAWGPRVVDVDIAEALAAYLSPAPSPAAEAATVRAVTRGAPVDEPDDAALAAAARVHPALRELVRRHRLDALTVRCFDLVKQLGTSGCLALADLNDAGITAGCEGDLPSTIAMVWTRLLLDRVPWMANPSQVQVDDGLLVLAHCTVPRSLTTGYRIRSHFESGLGAALAGTLAAGPVTLVRLGGRDLRSTWLAEGVAVDRPALEGLCRTQLTVRLPATAIEQLLTAPLGNHVVVVPGHHGARLTRWLSTTRAPLATG